MGTILKNLREEKGITQEELAEAVGVSKPFISQLENNRKGMSLATAALIADALGCTTDRLAGRNENEKE